MLQVTYLTFPAQFLAEGTASFRLAVSQSVVGSDTKAKVPAPLQRLCGRAHVRAHITLQQHTTRAWGTRQVAHCMLQFCEFRVAVCMPCVAGRPRTRRSAST